jgi:hypothetical protein
MLTLGRSILWFFLFSDMDPILEEAGEAIPLEDDRLQHGILLQFLSNDRLVLLYLF